MIPTLTLTLALTLNVIPTPSAVGKVPDEWIYDETVDGSILHSLRTAAKVSSNGVCDMLVANPIKASSPLS